MNSVPEVSKNPVNFDGVSAEIFDGVFDFFGRIDQEGKVLTIKGRIFARTGTNPELLAGQIFSQTVFWQSSENTPKNLDRAIADAAAGKQAAVVLDFRISAEDKQAVEVKLQPIKGADRREIFICGRTIAGSATPVGGSDPEREHVLFAAENADIGLWFWDFAENRIYSTPRCNELFEIPAYETLTYELFLNVVHPDDRSAVEEFLRQSRNSGGKYEEEFRIVHSDNSTEWICAEGRSFLDATGNAKQMTGVLRKITEQKLAAAELSKVSERERKARDEAVQANRAKDFFLAFVSHELRSPLNAILGWSKILLTRPVDEETRRNALETIEKSARFQTKLIDDLVDSARVASGKLRLEYRPTNLYEVIKTSFQAQKPASDAHKLEFELDSDSEQISIFGDAGRLQQVFGNLISNAIKFTPEGGKVRVEVRSSPEIVTVSVSDSGQGISPDALPNIFQQFSQGDLNSARKNAGLGLGLSIVKILVAKHNGSVVAESNGLGHGSTFVVTLPLTSAGEKRAEVQKEIEPADQLRLNGVSVLVVEDDFDSREVLQLFLEHNGASVNAVESAKLAMKSLRVASELPDIIISDLAMPEEDGYALLARIRKLPENKGGRIPALALSAFTTAESREKAFEAGFQKYATKPFEPDSIIGDILELTGKNGRTTF